MAGQHGTSRGWKRKVEHRFLALRAGIELHETELRRAAPATGRSRQEESKRASPSTDNLQGELQSRSRLA